MRYLSILLAVILTLSASAQSTIFQECDSTIVKGRVVNFENKIPASGFVAIYEAGTDNSSEILAGQEIDDSLRIAYVMTASDGSFEVKVPCGDYIIRISVLLALDITKRLSLSGDVIDLGVYDPFSPCYHLDEAPAMTAMRRRVYNRVMQRRMDGASTKYNVIYLNELENDNIVTTVAYSDFKTDSDIKSYYNSGAVITTGDDRQDREKTKSKMERYLAKMGRRYSKLEELYFREMTSLECYNINVQSK